MPARLRPRLALLTFIGVGVGLVVATGPALSAVAIEQRLRDLGGWAPAVFVAAYAVATLLFVPGSLVSLAGGALFGPVWGVAINLAGATSGAGLAFLAARYIAGDAVTGRVGPRLQHVIAGVEAEGWRFVAVVRLVPLVPFNLLNYALGLTRIRLVPYVLASAICMVPGAIAYTLGRACGPRCRGAWSGGNPPDPAGTGRPGRGSAPAAPRSPPPRRRNSADPTSTRPTRVR